MVGWVEKDDGFKEKKVALGSGSVGQSGVKNFYTNDKSICYTVVVV